MLLISSSHRFPVKNFNMPSFHTVQYIRTNNGYWYYRLPQYLNWWAMESVTAAGIIGIGNTNLIENAQTPFEEAAGSVSK